MRLFNTPPRAMLLALAVASLPSLQAGITEGATLPDLEQYSLEGTLPDLRNKIVLVDIWASWCSPCKASFPALDELHQELAAKGFVILGISADQKPADFHRFIQKMQPVFPTVRDRDQKLIAELGPPTMPTSYLFDRDGRLHAIHRGFHGDRSIQDLRRQIQDLLHKSK